MGAFCDIALAIGLTFGGLCAPPPETKPRALPEDDPAAWAIPDPPPPPPPPNAPTFPPIIIKAPAPPPPPPLVVAAPSPPEPEPEPEPDPPNPYRVWAGAQWAGRGRTLAPSGTLDTGDTAVQLASLNPGAPVGAMKPKPDYEGERRLSSPPVDNARIVTADRFITGILETGINSQLDGGSKGTVVIQTSRDVFGYHDRNALIPKGSRLICDYTSPKKMGSSRLNVECKRILMAGHRSEILELGSPVTNVQSQLGLTGEVDNRFGERYGTALMLAGISTIVRLTSAAAGSVASDGVGEVADKGAEELGTRFGEITAAVLEKTVDLAPIITVPQGTRVQIRPANDWYIREVTE
ncbi:MAG: TrbI/VirB10 family protein [Rhodospirillum sp.]|nr:TrbI/VirB10 family protein [Rhodospirillum sp.]